MFFFCEDCGAKNQLRPEQIQNERAIFRCITCGYANNYLLPGIKKTFQTHSSKHNYANTFLNRINTFPYIIGSFIYHPKKGIIASRITEKIKGEELPNLAEILSNNYSLCKKNYPDTQKETLFFKKKIWTVQPLGNNLFIAVAGTVYPFPKQFSLFIEELQKKW